jgi:myo-inositol 2-dehydrogenase / D-chiro-inositol 1-dehydrogenase
VTVLAVKKSPLGAAELRDPQIVLFEMAGGEVVTVESFVNCQYGYDVRCEIVGSTGTVSLDNPRTTVVIGGSGRRERVPADWRERFGPAYVNELQAWVDAVARGELAGPAGAASAWDGYAATAIAEAAVESYAKGQRVEIDLVDKPGLYA